MTERTEAEIIDLLGDLISPRGPGWRDERVEDHSHYNDPVEDREEGEPTGNSRRHGDIPPEDQVDIMNDVLDTMNGDSDLDAADMLTVLL